MKRTKEMEAMRGNGATYKAIGEAYGISKQRVYQITHKNNDRIYGKIRLTKEAVDWFFSSPHCCFKDRAKAQKICELRLSGMTYRAISEEVNLTENRVRQYAGKVQRKYDTYCRMNKKGGAEE